MMTMEEAKEELRRAVMHIKAVSGAADLADAVVGKVELDEQLAALRARAASGEDLRRLAYEARRVADHAFAVSRLLLALHGLMNLTGTESIGDALASVDSADAGWSGRAGISARFLNMAPPPGL